MKDFPDFIRRLPELDIPLPAVSGHLLQGANHQVAFVRFAEDTVVPAHSHSAQWELVVSGQVRLRIGGEEKLYISGESFYIPAGVEHGATVSAGYRAVVFVDEPNRYAAR